MKTREQLIEEMPEGVNRIRNQLLSTTGEKLSIEGLGLVWYLIEQEFGTNTPSHGIIEDLGDLIDQYWDIAWKEGNEGRTHDTEEGDGQVCQNKIDFILNQIQSTLDQEPVAKVSSGYSGDPDTRDRKDVYKLPALDKVETGVKIGDELIVKSFGGKK